MSDVDAFIDKTVEPSKRAAAKDASSVVCAATKGTPVIFVSDTFETHTGYRRADIVGRSLSILQGRETEPEAVEKFRQLIRDQASGTILITNYRADGSKFMHEIDFRPVRDDNEVVTHFVAIQWAADQT